jgi:intergrase/recombinase
LVNVDSENPELPLFLFQESMAGFIEGQTSKTIGAKHYMILLRQAKQYYPRYAEYITQLRKKAGLLTT